MAQRIKMIDRADNLRERSAAHASFQGLYVAESLLLPNTIGRTG